MKFDQHPECALAPKSYQEPRMAGHLASKMLIKPLSVQPRKRVRGLSFQSVR